VVGTLLRAVGKLATDRDVHLVIVGKPAPATERLAAQLSLADRITFTHGLDDEAFSALLASAASLAPLSLRSLDAIHLATAVSLQPDIDGIVVYDRRLAEAARAGFTRAIVPASTPVEHLAVAPGMKIQTVRTLVDALTLSWSPDVLDDPEDVVRLEICEDDTAGTMPTWSRLAASR